MTTPSPAANLVTREEFARYRLAHHARRAQGELPFDEGASKASETVMAPRSFGRLAGFVVRPLDQRRVEHRKRMLRHLMAQQ